MEDRSHLCRNRDLPETMVCRSRELRKRQTRVEDLLWTRLHRKQLDVVFRRQHPISHVILDFYCASICLGIELDGAIHLRPDVRERDTYKTELLTDLGIRLLRISNTEIENDIDGVIERLTATIKLLGR